MTRLKLGRLPATRPYGLKDFAVYAKGPLPAPPAAVPAPPNADPQMGLNDTYGDCTIAGANNLIGAWDSVFKEPDPRPTDDEIKTTYFTMTGGADSGLNEADVLQTWRTAGLFGNRIAAYAPVAPTDVMAHHQVIAYYGGAYLGIQCPQSAQEQFAAGQPWTYDPASPVEGGHCIVSVGYDAGGVWCVSWGSLVYVTYPFLAAYLEEVWAIISQELVEAKGDSLGIDLASLQSDLAAI